MLRFRGMKTLRKFASVHGQVHNHFNQERHIVDRQSYKVRRSEAFSEWRSVMAQRRLGLGDLRAGGDKSTLV